MMRKIIRVLDADVCQDEDGNAAPFLMYDDDGWPQTGVIGDHAGATLEELVGLCDHDAENVNAHDFCGTHRLLGAVLFRQYGRDAATITMTDIALRGGLHGMSGICSKGDSFEELGVGRSGHDWSGDYDEAAR